MTQEKAQQQRLELFMERLGEVIGHQDRKGPLRDYIRGLLLSGERKSVEPMAARIDPLNTRARHQSMHHFIAASPWSDDDILRVARDYALKEMSSHGPIIAWVIDDTGIPKNGEHSVGVQRQYCGNLGKQDNCQVAVSISLANCTMSVPASYRLYLPKEWCDDEQKRKEVGVPKDITFKTKGAIALDQIDALLADNIQKGCVIGDAAYGTSTEFRASIVDRGLQYAFDVQGAVKVWIADGSSGKRTRTREAGHELRVSLANIHKHLPEDAWISVTWREGTKGDLTSRFAAVRIRVAKKCPGRSGIWPEEWALIEWPEGNEAPEKFHLSNLKEDTPIQDLVNIVKTRWRIEHDYRELKDELGLDHYEGRGWRGFHHHGIACIAAFSFVIAERARLSPPRVVAFLRASPLPKGFRPRGSPIEIPAS